MDGGAPSPDGGLDPGIPPNPSSWSSVGALQKARFFHTATLLPDGQVLIVGGETSVGVPTASVELFDPREGTFRTLAALPTPRSHHIAALLPSGKVLIAGGGRSSGHGRTYPCDDVTASSLLYDPVQESVVAAAPMGVARSFAEATVLPGGEVLVVGGGGGTYHAGNALLADALFSAEIFREDLGWRSAGAMNTSRYFHTLSPLPGGDVLVVGGANETNASFKSAERFVVATGQFAPAGSMQTEDRFRHAAASLRDGRVLIAAGKQSNIQFLRTVELYDPEENAWTVAPAVAFGGNGATLTALPGGDVLFAGGFKNPTTSREALLFNAQLDRWEPFPPLSDARTVHTATLLQDGRVLVVGGMGEANDALASAEVAGW